MPQSSETIANPRSGSIAMVGVRLDNLTMNQTLDAVESFIADGGFHQIATANVDFLNKAFYDDELLQILRRCEIVVADGMPLVWASRALGAPLKERVTGADLLPRLFTLSASRGYRIFLLGATDESAAAALASVERDYPGAQICGRYSPNFAPLHKMDHEEILGRIAFAAPDILLVAFGNPKQEKWLDMHRPVLKVPVCIGVGASIDFISGLQTRAPHWMRRSSLEWTYRFFTNPRRLASRYLNNLVFVARYLSIQLLLSSMRPHELKDEGVTITESLSTAVIGISGEFTGTLVAKVADAIASQSDKSSLVLNLQDTTGIGVDGASLLLRLNELLGSRGGELWVTCTNSHVRRVFASTFPSGNPFFTGLTVADALRSLETGVLPITSVSGLALRQRSNRTV